MIYDCFTFYDEFDLLEIRLNELKDVVDKFIIAEGSITFQHNKKPYYFEENAHKFSEFEDKIIHIKCDDMPTGSTWETEFFQRESIYHCLDSKCEDNDIIIIENADEIASADAINRYLKFSDKKLMSLQQKHFCYYLNVLAAASWCWPKIMPYRVLKEWGSIRNVTREPSMPEIIDNGGWHFAYLGGAGKVAEKLQSFSHKEYNTKKHTSQEYLQMCVSEGRNFIDPKFYFDFLEIDESFPSYIVNNQEKFGHLIAPIG